MGFFDRLTDFGDRELVRTYAYRISVGKNQIKNETSEAMISSLSYAIRQDIEAMLRVASKLTLESINCLDVKVDGGKMPYTSFLGQIKAVSDEIVQKGGCRII